MRSSHRARRTMPGSPGWGSWRDDHHRHPGAIAIPVSLSQRRKAQNTVAKADASTSGKEHGTHYVEGLGTPSVSISGGHYVMNVDAVAGPPAEPAIVDRDLGKASANNAVGAQFYSNDTA
jgi:hypothetical protein